jgi:hypothetical protein
MAIFSLHFYTNNVFFLQGTNLGRNNIFFIRALKLTHREQKYKLETKIERFLYRYQLTIIYFFANCK